MRSRSEAAKAVRGAWGIDWTRFDHMLGTVPDKAVAALIGCTDVGVGERRRKLGILPFHKTHLTADEMREYIELGDQGLRRCRRCQRIKPLTTFDRNKAESTANGRDGYNRWCKECKAEYAASRIMKRRSYWIERAGGGCQNCGWSTWSVSLEFHHVDASDKDWVPAKLIMSRPIGAPQVEMELDKCVLLCANCHTAVLRGALKLSFKKRKGLGWTVRN